MDLQKTIKNLERRGFSVKYFDTGAEAAAYLEENVRGCSVGIGGCQSAEQLGLFEKLSAHNTVYWHWKVPGAETIAKANAADVYISGANALSEDGEILNIDGRGNRLAGQVYGDKKVYILAGTNKICPDFESALFRARNTACVLNGRRFNFKTPCKIDDKCHDCLSPDRICRALLVLWGPMMGMSTEVILVGEELGY